MNPKVLLRGGGDLASGVALRIFRAGWPLIICELAEPMAVRRSVSFAQVMYSQEIVIEGVRARRVDEAAEALRMLEEGVLPVLVDPAAEIRRQFQPDVLVDGRMIKQPPELGMDAAPLVIGMGPGFTVGENCHAVVETKRGPSLGRVYWQGSAAPDTGLPETVQGHQADRVLRAPLNGKIENRAEIGDWVTADQVVTVVDGVEVRAPFDSLVRGLLQDGLIVKKGVKIGDLDPRDEPALCELVSDKALAIGGGVLEAILTLASRRQVYTRA